MRAPEISQKRLSKFVALALLGTAACSSDGEGEQTDASPTSSGGDPSNQGNTGGVTGAGASTGTGGSGAATNTPPQAIAACVTRTLPERAGNSIHVEPAGPGRVSVEGEETTLRAVISGAQEGDTILLEKGIYTFDEAEEGSFSGLYVTTPHITIRGATANASDVILDSNYVNHGGQSGVISVDAPGVVLAHFTVQASIFHLVHLWEKGNDSLLHNVVLKDGGQQFLKASPGSGTVDGVEVSCSHFLMTEEGRANVWGYGDAAGNTRCYTGGIDTHNATNWHIHDSHFEGIYCDTEPGRPVHAKKGADRENMTYAGGLAEHAIHMWDSQEGSSHLIEGNRINDCARGIGLGLRDPVYGSVVRNNVITSAFAASSEHDIAISIERGIDTLVAHNTIFGSNDSAYANSIEIRWEESQNVEVHGNLSSHAIKLRDAATATLTDNFEVATAASFIDPDARDFELANCASAPEAARHPRVESDIDATERNDPSHAGAYECGD